MSPAFFESDKKRSRAFSAALLLLVIGCYSNACFALYDDCALVSAKIPKPPILTAVGASASSGSISGSGGSEAAAAGAYRLFLPDGRLSAIRARVAQDPGIYNALKERVDRYYNANPYNMDEFMAANLLLFLVDDSGSTRHLDKAKEYYNKVYNSSANAGWSGHTSRNGFRAGMIWAALYYSWAKDYLSSSEAAEIKANMIDWGQYWLHHIAYENNFANFRWMDSDETTSLAENLTILGYLLQEEYTGQELMNAGDCLLKRWVLGEFLNDIMAGGMWGEGSYYSPATVVHLARLVLFNREARNISLVDDYIANIVEGTVYSTLPTYSGTLPYGEIQAATDYLDLSGARYYNSMLVLLSALKSTSSIDHKIGSHWLKRVQSRHGVPATSSYTHVWRLLFEDTSIRGESPGDLGLPTDYFASGMDYVSVRSDWSEDATLFYLMADRFEVDHQEDADALSFGIARKGKWLSKEASGYGGAANSGTAHNTILIQNATSDGSSNPTLRPKGDGDILRRFNADGLAYVAADAADVYNMSGYYGTDYANLVSRQMAMLKPDLFVVYDHVITDPTQTRDLAQYQGINSAQHVRWVKYVQHFESQPTQSGGMYVSRNEDQRLYVQTLLPEAGNRSVKIVDEAGLWSGVPESNLPSNQRKWLMEVSHSSKSADIEFMHLMAAGDAGNTVLPASTELMTRENGRIRPASEDVKGIAVKISGEWHVLIFPEDPGSDLGTVSYDLSFIGSGEIVNHYIFAADGDAGYSNTVEGKIFRSTASSAAGSTEATGGVIMFRRPL